MTKPRRVFSSAWVSAMVVMSAALAAWPEARALREGSASRKDHREVLSRTSKAFNEIAKQAMPAVVSIRSVRRGLSRMSGHRPGEPKSWMLGIGSGAIIRPDGLILTNYHVVEEAQKITVQLDEKSRKAARLVAADPKTDLALIQLEGMHRDLPVLKFGNSDQMQVGDWAIAIGSPFGLNRSVSFGIISATGRAQMGMVEVEDFIQTDAAINPGSSGGPLLNAEGDIVGINTAIFSQGNAGFVGIGFAVPSAIARDVVRELIDHGRVRRGWMGLAAQDLDEDLAKYFGVSPANGVLVSDVRADSPASRASIRAGDIILAMNERSVGSAAELKSSVGKSAAGGAVKLKLFRDGKPRLASVDVQEAPSSVAVQKMMAGIAAPGRDPERSLGLVVQDVTDDIAKLLELPRRTGALVTQVRPGSAAFDAGIAPGDIILKANGSDVRSARELKRVTRKPGPRQLYALYVQRGTDDRSFVPVRVGD